MWVKSSMRSSRLRAVTVKGTDSICPSERASPEVRADLENGHAIEVRRAGREQLHAVEAPVGTPEPEPRAGLHVPRELAADLHAIDFFAALVELRQHELLEQPGRDRHAEAEEDDGRADAIEADPRRLERGELLVAGEREEQEDRRDEHHDRQPVVQPGGQAVDEVLEDVGEGWLDAEEAVERLREIDDDEERRRDRETDEHERDVRPHEIAVDDVAGVGR